MAISVSSRIIRALLEQAAINATTLKLLATITMELDPESKNKNFETILNNLVGDNDKLLEMIESAFNKLDEEQNGG